MEERKKKVETTLGHGQAAAVIAVDVQSGYWAASPVEVSLMPIRVYMLRASSVETTEMDRLSK